MNPRILIIEDDEIIAGRVSAFLEEAGYEVIRAVDATAGLAMLYEKRPDLVIMADSLPVLNGEDPCLRLRQASYLPIIILGGIYDAVEALEMGADAYMSTPPGREELVARVNALLRRQSTDYREGRWDSDPGLFTSRESIITKDNGSGDVVIDSSGNDALPNNTWHYDKDVEFPPPTSGGESYQ